MPTPKKPGEDRAAHERDSDRLQRVRQRRMEHRDTPPPPSLELTRGHRLGCLVVVLLVTLPLAKLLVHPWEMTWLGAWMVMVGILLMIGGAAWRGWAIWEEISHWPLDSLLNFFLWPKKFIFLFFHATSWKQMKVPFFLSLFGILLILLGFVQNAVFHAPST
ncbi:hypothetical protein H8D30_03405 [bacterium]|nr:hypothetical protein [bacterium]